MKILVINAGSTSIKLSIFDNEAPIFSKTLECSGSVEETLVRIPVLLKEKGFRHFDAVGHRIAHGGCSFYEPCLIDEAVREAIETFIPLAPLHNPPNLAGIRMAQAEWPSIPQVAVFDTAFHRTMPELASTYAVPEEWRNMGVQKYGFHGTSHKYIMQRVAAELQTQPEKLRIISCHLGGGTSVCAIDGGKSVDTSMGMTALAGPVMGTRCGDVDPGLSAFLERTAGLMSQEIENRLYHDSGLKALAGTGDMRILETRAAEGDLAALFAIKLYAYRIRQYIGSYAAVMNGVDVVAFTGGIGENAASVRDRICHGLDFMGLELDEHKNSSVKLQAWEAEQIQTHSSRVKIIVTQTREQWMIAQDVRHVLKPECVNHAMEARK